MNRSIRSLVFAAALVGLSAPAFAGITVLNKPKVSFFATGSPGWLDIEGVTNTLTAADDGTNVTFTVPMTTVETGIGLRDDHMNNEYVDVAKFPNAVMKLTRADVQWPAASGQKTTGKAKADFNIHGQSQPVEVTYTNTRTAKGYKVKASFNFDAGKSGITITDNMGVTVDPKMRAEVEVELTE